MKVGDGFNFGCGCILCLFVVGALCLLIPACGLVGLVKLSNQIQSVEETNHAPENPVAPGVVKDESAYRGTSDTAFGKDWVVVDGVKLTGITMVNASPGAQVALVYSDGGKNVAVDKLPQGFLDEWKITEDALKKADDQ